MEREVNEVHAGCRSLLLQIRAALCCVLCCYGSVGVARRGGRYRISWVSTYGQTGMMWYPYPNFATGSELIHDVIAEARTSAPAPARSSPQPQTTTPSNRTYHQPPSTITMASDGTNRPGRPGASVDDYGTTTNLRMTIVLRGR